MSPATTGTHQGCPRLLSLTKSTRGARVIRKQLRRAHAANSSPGLDALETVWNVQSEGRGEGGRRDDIATIQPAQTRLVERAGSRRHTDAPPFTPCGV